MMTITKKSEEPEITVDTLEPVLVAPPTLETDSIAVPVIAVDITNQAKNPALVRSLHPPL
jgi:hypothetical protein